MTNFEKFKKELTIDELADLLENGCSTCEHCAYDVDTCSDDDDDCEYGIKKYLESEVE